MINRFANTIYPLLKSCLRIKNAAVVEIWSDFLGEKLEQKLGWKLIDVLIEFLLKVELNFLDQQFPFAGA